MSLTPVHPSKMSPAEKSHSFSFRGLKSVYLIQVSCERIYTSLATSGSYKQMLENVLVPFEGVALKELELFKLVLNPRRLEEIKGKKKNL